MNIETLRQYCETFKREVVNSGFKRDIEDYINSLPSAQSNILALREISQKVMTKLDEIYSGDLPNALTALLPKPEIPPFTDHPYDKEFHDLNANTEIPKESFFEQLNTKLTQLRKQIKQNSDEIAKIESFIGPYSSVEISEISEENLAIISIVFNDKETISSLGKFSKTVASWNRILPIYHQLLKSDPPEDISLLEVQNGSIDLIVNLDVDVAIDLAELFKVGFKVFAAYLSYKKILKPIIESYHGNKKLIADEVTRETLMLENIGEAVKVEIQNQHKRSKKTDKKIDTAAVAKKVEQVASLVTSHIVKGNDVKVLALPEATVTAPSPDGKVSDIRSELREKSSEARRALREIPAEAKQQLLLTYGKIEEDKE